MKINPVCNTNPSFGYKGSTSKIVGKITKEERIKLARALGLHDVKSLKDWEFQFENLGKDKDILSGSLFPNTHITTKGDISPREAMMSMIRIELAKIRGEIKPVPLSEFNL